MNENISKKHLKEELTQFLEKYAETVSQEYLRDMDLLLTPCCFETEKAELQNSGFFREYSINYAP